MDGGKKKGKSGRAVWHLPELTAAAMADYKQLGCEDAAGLRSNPRLFQTRGFLTELERKLEERELKQRRAAAAVAAWTTSVAKVKMDPVTYRRCKTPPVPEPFKMVEPKPSMLSEPEAGELRVVTGVNAAGKSKSWLELYDEYRPSPPQPPKTPAKKFGKKKAKKSSG